MASQLAENFFQPMSPPSELPKTIETLLAENFLQPMTPPSEPSIVDKSYLTENHPQPTTLPSEPPIVDETELPEEYRQSTIPPSEPPTAKETELPEEYRQPTIPLSEPSIPIKTHLGENHLQSTTPPSEPSIVNGTQVTEDHLHPTTLPSEPSIANGSQLAENHLQSKTSSDEPSIAVENPRKRRLYCLTVCGYRKPTISETDYVEYMTKKHSKLVRGVMAKHGVIRWTHAHNTVETRKLMGRLYDSQFANVADYDCFSQSIFESVDSLVGMKEDPMYNAFIRDDHENFADTKRTKITIGWFEEYITDGQAVKC